MPSCVMIIQVCSNEGPNPFLWGDNSEIAKIHWRNLNMFFSRTVWPISTKFGTNHLWVKGIQVCSNEEPFKSHKVNYGFFLLLLNIMINIWFNDWTVFQLSDVAHEPLVYLSISEGLLYFPPGRCSLKALETSLWNQKIKIVQTVWHNHQYFDLIGLEPQKLYLKLLKSFQMDTLLHLWILTHLSFFIDRQLV